MAHRKKVGDLYAIYLPDNTFAFGRVLQEVSVAFYKHRADNIKDLPHREGDSAAKAHSRFDSSAY